MERGFRDSAQRRKTLRVSQWGKIWFNLTVALRADSFLVSEPARSAALRAGVEGRWIF